jgi:hypothetical protein
MGNIQVSSTRNQLSRSEHHGDTALVSRTPGGGHGSRRNSNCQSNEGHPSARGNNEQKVQQPPHNQRGARHHGQDPLEANLHDAPTIDLRQKINEGHDAQLVIEVRRRDRTGRRHDDNDSDRFPSFSTSITDSPIQRTSNQSESPSTTVSRTHASGFDATPFSIEVLGGSNSTKALYFPVALESVLLTWLESLKPNSIDSWEDLKRAFIGNYQGSMIRAGTRHDLSR